MVLVLIVLVLPLVLPPPLPSNLVSHLGVLICSKLSVSNHVDSITKVYSLIISISEVANASNLPLCK